MYSTSEEWDRVVELTTILLGQDTAGTVTFQSFHQTSPNWLQAGFLFAEICIRMCKRQAGKAFPETIWPNGRPIDPTQPHDYLGYTRRCFNSGLCRMGSDSSISIPAKDWLKCQPSYSPRGNPDLELCARLAEAMRREAYALFKNSQHTDENPLLRAYKLADRLIEEKERERGEVEAFYGKSLQPLG